MRDLTSGPEGRLVFAFAVPMLIGNVFQQFYNMVDSVVVGQFVGKDALAAVGVSFPILFLLISLVMGMGMGSSILLAQYYGAKNMDKVRRTVETTYIFLFFACLAVTAVGLAAGGAILRVLRTPEEILPQARLYLNILFAGMILLFGYNSFAAILRGVGDSKTPLYFLIVATLTNIALDLLFVLAFHWGVAGVAWATVISQGLSFLLGVLYFRRPELAVLRIHLTGMRFDAQIFRQSLQIGLPSAVQQVLVALGMLALSRIVNVFGTTTIAAYTAGTRLETFATMPAMNFGMALSAFVGQNVGAGRLDRVRRGFFSTLWMSGALSLSISALVVVFRAPLIRLFNADAGVAALGTRYLLIVGGGYVLFSTMFTTGGLLRGAGDTLTPMLVTLMALWVVRVPAATLLSRRLATDGIWLATPVGWAVGMILLLAWYAGGRWKRKAQAMGTMAARRQSHG
jgi:putative MATE family efflux protein